MESLELELTTPSHPVTVDITAHCSRFVADKGDGLLSVFVPHATAGLAVLETGAASDNDLLDALDSLLPTERSWAHQHGSPGHGRDHVVPALISPSLTIPVVGGHLTLGTWQSIVLVDTNIDNSRRRMRLSFLKG